MPAQKKIGYASRSLSTKRFGKSGERDLAVGFFRRLQLKPRYLRSTERPDFKAYFPTAQIGLELALFYNDRASWGSAGRRLFETWYRIACDLRERLLAAGLPYLYGSVQFKSSSLDRVEHFPRKDFLDELVAFCQSRHRRRQCVTIRSFPGYPVLSAHVESVHLDGTYPRKSILVVARQPSDRNRG